MPRKGTMMATRTGQIIKTPLHNAKAVALTVHVEPWGEQYVMPPGTTYEVIARGPAGDTLEIALEDESITLWGWAGSVVTLLFHGVELGPSRPPQSAAPAVPIGSQQPGAGRA